VASPFYPYQARAIEAGATLLAAPPGSGKTAVAIELARRIGAELILVVGPAISSGVWLAEVPKWWPGARTVLLRTLVAGGVRWLREDLPDEPGPLFVITSYDYLVVNREARALLGAADGFDLAILDESHAKKSPAAKRTRLLFGPRCAGDGLLSRAERTILLSGTPCPNGLPSELWPALRATAPGLIDHLPYEAFVGRYCLTRPRRMAGGRTVEQIVGANPRTAPALAERLRGWWHRPPAAEIERDLPPLRLEVRPLPLESVDQTALDELEDSPEAAQLRAAVATGDLRHIEGNVARLRRLLARLKVQGAAAWIEEALSAGEPKVLAWAWHTEPLHQLAARLRRHQPLLIEGATPAADRAAAVARFQTDPRCRVFLGQIQAAGQAITLTAGRRAVFLEQAFIPGLNHQALKRCHRIGQHHPVLGEVLIVPDSIDEAVNALLVRKTRDIALLEERAA
jgi:SNF2 family DNA or RNA helicase